MCIPRNFAGSWLCSGTQGRRTDNQNTPRNGKTPEKLPTEYSSHKWSVMCVWLSERIRERHFFILLMYIFVANCSFTSLGHMHTSKSTQLELTTRLPLIKKPGWHDGSDGPAFAPKEGGPSVVIAATHRQLALSIQSCWLFITDAKKRKHLHNTYMT